MVIDTGSKPSEDGKVSGFQMFNLFHSIGQFVLSGQYMLSVQAAWSPLTFYFKPKTHLLKTRF